MALPAALAFTVKFDRTTTPTNANFEIEDTTNWAGESIAVADVRLNYKIVDPLTNIIHNTTSFASPDISRGSTALYTGTNIPKDSTGAYMEGAYQFTASAMIDHPITAINTGTKQFTIAGDYVALIQAAGSITVVRSSAGNNGTYTVTGVVLSGSHTVITVSQAIPSSTISGSIQYSTQTVYTQTSATSITYQNIFPTIDIDLQYNCLAGTFTSIDATTYGSSATIVSRTHTVKYPATLNIADAVSTSISNPTVSVTGGIWTTRWYSIVETRLNYDLGNGNIVDITLKGTDYIDVNCDLSLCEISCCLIKLNNRYLDNKVANTPEAAKYFQKLTRVAQLMEMFQLAQICGNETQQNQHLAEIKVVAECSDECGCSDSTEPQQIIPLSGSSGTVRVTAGYGITVTTLVNGSITEYQVALSASIQSIINAATPVSVLQGTGVTVTSAVVGGVTQYTVSATAWTVSQMKSSVYFRAVVEYAGAGTATPSVTVTVANVETEGANMQSPTVFSSGSAGDPGGVNANWKNIPNLFKVQDFMVSANDNYKVEIEAVVMESLAGSLRPPSTVSATNQYLQQQRYFARVLNQTSGELWFQFVDANGNPYGNAQLAYMKKAIVNILIKQ